MASKQDQCVCGELKDVRAVKCRACFQGQTPESHTCTRCRETKPLAEFRIRTRATPKPRSRCKSCEALDALDTRKRDPERAREVKARAAVRAGEKWHSLTPTEKALKTLRISARSLGLNYDEILARYLEHDGACEICGDTPKEGARFARPVIDHDHDTGAFRGFLCGECNLGLGKFKDSAATLRAAAEYLESRT